MTPKFLLHFNYHLGPRPSELSRMFTRGARQMVVTRDGKTPKLFGPARVLFFRPGPARNIIFILGPFEPAKIF